MAREGSRRLHNALVDILCCPVCRGSLRWHITEREGVWIQRAEATCSGGHAFEVRDGIADLLHPAHGSSDLWQTGSTALQGVLSQQPDVAARLLAPTPDGLCAADRFFRVFALEARGRMLEALSEEEPASIAVYGVELRRAFEEAAAFVQSSVTPQGVTVDLASGRGTLLRHLLDAPSRLLVATDISLTGLQSLRRRLAVMGDHPPVNLLVADAHRLPFADESIDTLTTWAGLPNIDWEAGQPADTLRELRRVTRGEFYNAQTFYPLDDLVHRHMFEASSLSAIMYETPLLNLMRQTGWAASIEMRQDAMAYPSPPSELFPDWQIDLVPVRETRVSVCVVVGR